MISQILSMGRPLAMKALSNPNILGPILISAVGAKGASEIQNELSTGKISLDDVYNTFINAFASPVVGNISEMGSVDTPDGAYLGPTQEELDRAQREWDALTNRGKTITPIPEEKKVKVDDIGFTQAAQTPQIISSPTPPEEKVKVEDIGFTPTEAPKIRDMILTAEDTKYIKDKDKLDQIFQGQDNLFKEGDYGDPKVYFENVNTGYGFVPFYEAWEDAYQGGVADLGDPKAASKITKYDDYKEYQTMIQNYFRENVGDQFVTYRLTTEEDAKKFLNTDVKSYQAKSFTMSPRQAISFAYFANEKFMDMNTYQPKDNLVLLEVPIKPEYLVMRGKSGEKEVVAKTNKIDKSDIRVYNPYTGEVVQDATTGFLKDSPLLDLGSEAVPTIKINQNEETETIKPGQYTTKDVNAWLKKREEEFEKESAKNLEIEQINSAEGGIDFAPEKTANNIRLHLDRLNKLKEGKIDSYPGGPQNERTVLKAPEGTNLPDIAIGKITFDDWKNRVEKSMSPEDILKAAGWYKKIFDEFDALGAGSKKERDKMATAWLAGQQNETPTNALTNVLYIYEQYKQGVPYTEIIGKGLPTVNKIVKDIIFEKKVEGGAGQKISDFIDAGYGKLVRSIMGNDPNGGSPFVVDIHTARDTGLVDQTFLNKLKQLGYVIPEGIKLDLGEGGITGTKYENRAMFGRELTDYLNSINWQGKSDWIPAEIQAIGWMNLTDMYGELGTSGDVTMALSRNLKRIAMEALPGEGSPWATQFGEKYKSLPPEQQEYINNLTTSEAIKFVNETFGTNFSGVIHGTGGWELYQNPSTVQQTFSSKENARKAGALLGYLLNQNEVWVNSAKEMTKNPKHFGVDLVELDTNNLRNSDTLKKFFQYFIDNDQNGLFKGYQPIETLDGKTGIRIIIDNDAIKNSPLKKADVLPYIQDFVDNKLSSFTGDLDFSVQPVIQEIELEKLINDWSINKNGESFKKYFSDEAGTITPLKSWSDISNYWKKLTDLFGSEIEKAKGTSITKKRKGGYVMPLPKIDML